MTVLANALALRHLKVLLKLLSEALKTHEGLRPSTLQAFKKA